MHHGYAVHVFDMPGGCLHPRNGVTYDAGDVTSADQLAAAFAGASVVVHAAAPPSACQDAHVITTINVEGTRAVISAVSRAQVRALVFTSAAAVVYEGEDLTDVDERQPYASVALDAGTETRARAEALVLGAAKDAGLVACAIRSATLYGPMDDGFTPALAAAGYSGASRIVVGGGKTYADFCYAENAAYAHALAADALLSDDPARRGAVEGRAFFITDGAPQPFWQFTGRIVHGLGYSAPWLRLPPFLASMVLGGLSGRARRFAATHHTYSTEAAKRALGYEAPVSVDAAVDATVKAFAHARASALGADPVRLGLELLGTLAVSVAVVLAALTVPLPAAAIARETLAERLDPVVDLFGPSAIPQARLLVAAGMLAVAVELVWRLLPRAGPLRAPRVLPPTIPGVPVLGISWTSSAAR